MATAADMAEGLARVGGWVSVVYLSGDRAMRYGDGP